MPPLCGYESVQIQKAQASTSPPIIAVRIKRYNRTVCPHEADS